jgi:hypothetical protein
MQITCKTDETSDYMLNAVIMKAQGLYMNSPTHATPISQETLDVIFSQCVVFYHVVLLLIFLSDMVQFGVIKSVSTILHLNDTHTCNTTIAGILANLKWHRDMSEKDIKGHTLSLQV